MRVHQATGISFLFGLLSLAVVANADPEADKTLPKVTRGTPAIAIEKAPPVYPQEMLRRGIEGWVQVGFVIDEEGSTRDIQILNNSEALSFDRAAIAAVSKWKFKPATWDGKPVPETKLRQRLVFIIKNSKDDADVSIGVSRKFKSRISSYSDRPSC